MAPGHDDLPGNDRPSELFLFLVAGLVIDGSTNQL
jgi:hypothetical protein